MLSSLLLGIRDVAGELHHIGVVQAFTRQRRRDLLDELASLRVPLRGHPWEHGFLVGGGPTGGRAGAAGRCASGAGDPTAYRNRARSTSSPWSRRTPPGVLAHG